MAQAYFKSVTCDYTQAGTGDSTNWPLTIHVTDADFRTIGNGGYVANALGYDLRVYTTSGLSTQLDIQLAYYNASTGEVDIRARLPTLSASANTIVYIGLGDTGIVTDGSTTSVWDSSTDMVQHFGDGSTLDLNDSTSHSSNLTNHNVTATAAVVVGGASLNGTNAYLDHASALNYTAAPFTIGLWINSQSLIQDGTLVFRGQYQAGGYYIYFSAGTTQIQFATNQSGAQQATLSTPGGISIGNWHLVHVVYTGPGAKIFVDDTDATSSAGTHIAPDSSSDPFQIGAYYPSGTPVLFFPGFIDEFTASHTARNADWITATYNNQKPSSTFITYGSLTPAGGPAGDGTADVDLPHVTMSSSGLTKSTGSSAISLPHITIVALGALGVVSNATSAITLGALLLAATASVDDTIGDGSTPYAARTHRRFLGKLR